MHRVPVLLLALVFLVMPGIEALAQELDIDPAIDQSKIQLQSWWADVKAHYLEILTPSAPLPAKIPVLTWGSTSSGPTVALDSYPGGDISLLNQNAYRSLTESFFQEFCTPVGGTQSFDLDWQLLGAKVELFYALMNKLDPTRYPTPTYTTLGSLDLRNNDPKDVAGGSTSIMGNVNPFNSLEVSAPFKLLAQKMNGSLKPIDEELNKAFGAYRLRPYPGWGRYEALLAIDKAVNNTVNGVLPSTFINQFTPGAYLHGPDGIFFQAEIAPLPSYNWVPINPTGFRLYFVKRSAGNFVRSIPISMQNYSALMDKWTVRYELADANGKVLVSDTVPACRPNYNNTEVNCITNITWPIATANTSGAYRLSAWVLQTGSSTPLYADCTYAIRYPDYNAGIPKLFAITNGPDYYTLSEKALVVDGSAGSSVERYPGLLVFTGLAGDVMVADGGEHRVFTPDRDVSTVYLFTRRDQPYVYEATDAAVFGPAVAVPGSIITLWTWGATHGDPAAPWETFSRVSCNGRTRVIVTDTDGTVHEAPFWYCSQNQLNIVVPEKLRGSNAKVRVMLGETLSNEIEVPVETVSPRIFQRDLVAHSAAALFASGPKAGELVTAAYPAKPGDELTVIATGLGPTNPSLPDKALAESWQYRTTNPVTAQGGGKNWEVSFSGLIPGAAGVYAVNVRVPQGSGETKLSVNVAGKTSNEVLIAVE